MESLRITGVALGLFGLIIVWFVRFRLKRLRNVDWVAGSVLSLGLVLAGLAPGVFNAFLEYFSFEAGGGGRLLGLLVFSNLVLYVLAYVALSRANKVEQALDRVVRAYAKREFRKDFPGVAAEIYVVIPAYNEAGNIPAVIKLVPDEVSSRPVKCLVVIDGATDDTEDVVREMDQAMVSYAINRGGGSALRAGYEIAVEDGAEIVVTLDADGQHRPEEIPLLVQPIIDGEADLVSGSRVLGSAEGGSRVRAVGIVFFNWLVSVLTYTRVTDCSNGFRAIRASELARLELRQVQFHTSELLIEALKQGLRYTEVPVTVKGRLSGKSKKPMSLRYGWGFLKAIVTTWAR